MDLHTTNTGTPVCNVCGRGELTLSCVVLCPNYGSRYDDYNSNNKVTVSVCATCFDSLYEKLVCKTGEYSLLGGVR